MELFLSNDDLGRYDSVPVNVRQLLAQNVVPAQSLLATGPVAASVVEDAWDTLSQQSQHAFERNFVKSSSVSNGVGEEHPHHKQPTELHSQQTEEVRLRE
jgi:hypothetical protein